MQIEVFFQEWAKLRVKFPGSNESDFSRNFYYEELVREGFTDDEVIEAVRIALRGKFFPSVNELVESVRGNQDEQDLQEWQTIATYPWHSAYKEGSANLQLSPAGYAALKAIGGLYTVHTADRAETTASLRKQFLDLIKIKRKDPTIRALKDAPQLPAAQPLPEDRAEAELHLERIKELDMPDAFKKLYADQLAYEATAIKADPSVPLQTDCRASESAEGLGALKNILKSMQQRAEQERLERSKTADSEISASAPDENFFASPQKIASKEVQEVSVREYIDAYAEDGF